MEVETRDIFNQFSGCLKSQLTPETVSEKLH